MNKKITQERGALNFGPGRAAAFIRRLLKNVSRARSRDTRYDLWSGLEIEERNARACAFVCQAIIYMHARSTYVFSRETLQTRTRLRNTSPPTISAPRLPQLTVMSISGHETFCPYHPHGTTSPPLSGLALDGRNYTTANASQRTPHTRTHTHAFLPVLRRARCAREFRVHPSFECGARARRSSSVYKTTARIAACAHEC